MRPVSDTRAGLRQLGRLALPIVGSRLGIMAMGLTDTIVTGRNSGLELARLTLGWAPTAVVLMAGLGLLSGVPMLVSRYIGEGRPEATGAVLRRAAGYALVLGAAAVAVLWGPVAWGLTHAGLEPRLASGAAQVARILALSMPAILLTSAATLFLEAHGRASTATVATWLGNAINLGVNLWLVPGHSGLPVAGAEGSAWATLASRLFIAAYLGVALWRWQDAHTHGVWRASPADRAAAAEQRRIGYAAGGSYSVETAAFSAMGLFTGWLGPHAVAAWGIVLNVAAVIFMVPLGLSGATNVLVGRAYGAGDRHDVMRQFRLGTGVTVAVLTLICLGMLAGAGLVAGLYTRDAGVAAAAVGALQLSCLFYISDGLQVVGAQSLRARGDIWWPTWLHVFSYAAVMMPLGWLLSRWIGLPGVVWAVVVASAMAGGLLVGRFLWLGRRPLS